MYLHAAAVDLVTDLRGPLIAEHCAQAQGKAKKVISRTDAGQGAE
ncbi:MAG: hypothetical protein QF615_01795 [Planctomycetota bacterium]|nr:hypothetical protein [Planctomycetota bacterium]